MDERLALFLCKAFGCPLLLHIADSIGRFSGQWLVAKRRNADHLILIIEWSLLNAIKYLVFANF
jgi:hypothetical protein